MKQPFIKIVEVDGCQVVLQSHFYFAGEREGMFWDAVEQELIKKGDPVGEFTDAWSYGWKVAIGANQYGDFIMLRADATDKDWEEAEQALLSQAEMVIEKVRG